MNLPRFKVWMLLLLSFLGSLDAADVRLSDPRILGGSFQFSFTAQPSTAYSVQSSSNLLIWTGSTALAPIPGPFTFIDKNSPTNSRRFYRVTAPRIVPTPNMVFIPAGTFSLGSPDNELDRSTREGPQIAVTLTRGFWMAKYEVTQNQFVSLMKTNPSANAGDLNRPVENLSWVEAVSFCEKLTAQERALGKLAEGWGYRLPTEAEWEYACRAGTRTRFSFGDDLDYARLRDYAWYSANAQATTHPVGTKLPNPWGLYDMHGNVCEFCLDWYGGYRGGILTDPSGPTSGFARVLRGGTWFSEGKQCRSADRANKSPEGRDELTGFRFVLAIGP